MADIFVRSKSVFCDFVMVEFLLVVSTGSTAALFCSVTVGFVSVTVFIVFLLQESKALGIVASRPQARMAED